MARIRQLPPEVVAQVKAGEVIERPASVVKELLENSIDAGAGRIDVEVQQGGHELIRVSDDGGGIEPDDLPLALASHATSKIQTAQDLFGVSTLGFRGEGLASIAGVAQVTIQSRPPHLPSGAEVRCNGGEMGPVRVWSGAPGTRVEVRHLFFNTPARRKFLRSPAAEFAQITEAFLRLALSQLSLHLTLRHNGKLVHEVPATAGLLDRIALFFGREVRDKLYPLQAEEGRTTVGGYVGDPMSDRPGPQLQYLFVNGRWVRDRGLSQALQEAYRGLLMTGRHPAAFLFLEVPPDEVDVNVHPTKAEVRFRRAERLQQLVMQAVRARLQGEDLTASLRPPVPPPPAPVRPPGADAPGSPAPEEVAAAQPALPFADGGKKKAPEPARQAERRTEPGPSAEAKPARPASKAPAPKGEKKPPTPASDAPGSPRPAPAHARPVKAVQMHDLYLVVEVPEGILLIDQHALHERLLFEQLKEKFRQGTLEVQKLLIPEPVSLSAAQAALVLEQRPALAELGVLVEDFGAGTVLLRGCPALLGKRPAQEVFRGVVEYLTGKERPPDRDAFLNDLLSVMACHAAVRAGDRLSQAEIAALVEQRHLARDSHHCPHGRPTSLLFTRQDLDRQFGRT